MVIIDTSVAVKWFFSEEGSMQARDLLRQEPLGAPDLLLYEFTNVLVSKAFLSVPDIEKFLDLLYQCPVQFFVLPQKGFRRTLEICRQFKLTAYDASFLALAEAVKADFVTADEKLARQVRSLSFVHTLC